MDAVFVNICDLVDSPNTGEPVENFPSEVLLADYSKRTGKIFPKENAYAGGLLRYLLRHIKKPRGGTEGQSSHILAQTGSSRSGQNGRWRGR